MVWIATWEAKRGQEHRDIPSTRFDAVVDSIPRVVAIERESGAGELSEQRVQRGTPVSFSLSLSLSPSPSPSLSLSPSFYSVHRQFEIPSVVHYVSPREKLAFGHASESDPGLAL